MRFVPSSHQPRIRNADSRIRHWALDVDVNLAHNQGMSRDERPGAVTADTGTFYFRGYFGA